MDAKSISTYVGHKNCFVISASRTIRWKRFPLLRTRGFQSSGQAVSARRNIHSPWIEMFDVDKDALISALSDAIVSALDGMHLAPTAEYDASYADGNGGIKINGYHFDKN